MYVRTYVCTYDESRCQILLPSYYYIDLVTDVIRAWRYLSRQNGHWPWLMSQSINDDKPDCSVLSPVRLRQMTGNGPFQRWAMSPATERLTLYFYIVTSEINRREPSSAVTNYLGKSDKFSERAYSLNTLGGQVWSAGQLDGCDDTCGKSKYLVGRICKVISWPNCFKVTKWCVLWLNAAKGADCSVCGRRELKKRSSVAFICLFILPSSSLALSLSLPFCFPRCLSLPKSGSLHMAAFFCPPSVSLSLHIIPEVFISGRRWRNSDTHARARTRTHTYTKSGWDDSLGEAPSRLCAAEHRIQLRTTAVTPASQNQRHQSEPILGLGAVLNSLTTGLDCVRSF